ncbi:MAG: tetratricopeptide repeat protein [Acidobacteria bacterium]|nr:tetratricopeptide repeat protein [Acidobacteriota bacterium]
MFGIERLRALSRALLPASLAALLAVTAGCAGRETTRARPFKNMDTSVAYVGSESCRPCHAQIGESFATTGMGRSLYPLTPDRVVEDFTRKNRFDVVADRISYEMVAGGDDHFMRMDVHDADGSVLTSATRKIRYVIGSGNHSRSYVSEDGGGLYQMPICWYPDKPGWDLCPGYELNGEHFGRKIEASCLFCHDARVSLAAGTENHFAEPLPHGIDCERCHGPGDLHVARWKTLSDHPPESDDTIVNPRKLGRVTRIQVCLQCHLGDSDAGARVTRPDHDLRDFRPGGHIGEYLDVLSFDPPMANRFGLGSQGDRLMLSRCYKESGGGVDCLTCHDPHVSVFSKSRPADQFRRACLTCHTTASCAVSEPERRRQSALDDCVACHMRRSEPADQRYTAFTDHWIRRRIDPPAPPAAERPGATLSVLRVGGEPEGGEGPTAFSMGVAYFAKKMEGTYSSLIPWSKPEGEFRSVVEREPTLAEGWHMLGTVALRQGHITEAIGDFREALKLKPDHARARRQLAAALLLQGRAGEAEPLLRRAVAENPSDIAAMSDLARALVVLGSEGEAGEILARALGLDPGEPTLRANQGMLEARLGRHTDAVPDLRAAASLAPGVPEIWDALASSLIASHQVRAALGPARRAVTLRPTLSAAQYHFGVALAAAGELREARAAFQMAVTLNPASSEALAALSGLPEPGALAQSGTLPPPRAPGARPAGGTPPPRGPASSAPGSSNRLTRIP